MVRIPERVQRLAGIRVVSLPSVSFSPETVASGRVVDIQPLIALRNRYKMAESAQTAANARARESRSALERTRKLQTSGAVSSRQLQQARSGWVEENARRSARHAELALIREQATLGWGKVLARTFLDAKPGDYAEFASHRRVLIRVVLKPGTHLPESVKTIHISRASDRGQARAATLVSRAPGSAAGPQGESWFFSAPAADLWTGMKLSAWIPDSANKHSGLRIPAAAIVWHSGSPWIYVRHEQALFSRRKIIEYTDLGDVWFSRQPDTLVNQAVIQGAQTLLSEEYRWQIPDEDD